MAMSTSSARSITAPDEPIQVRSPARQALEEKKLELSDGNAGAMTRSRPGERSMERKVVLPEVTSEMIEAGVDALMYRR